MTKPLRSAIVTLDQLLPEQQAEVTTIGGRGAFRRRLMELGMVPGTPVVRSGQAPLGDPLAFRVRGAVLCLRRAEAACVTVQLADPVSGSK